MIVAYALHVVEEAIPSTYRKAEISLESKMWKDATEEEMSSLHKNDTWQLTELPYEKKAIGCKWVYIKKQESLKEDIVRYKARLVVKGYTQREGIDYNKVFFPVVKHSSIRILLALVAQLSWTWPARCEDHLSPWRSWWGVLYVSADGVQNYRKEEYSMQAEEIAVWIETIS